MSLSLIKVSLFGSSNATTKNFTPSKDIPSLSDRVLLITGAAGDLGRQTAIDLASYGRPSQIFIADLPRPDEGASALEAIRSALPEDARNAVTLTYLPLDLSSFASIRSAASKFLSASPRLDTLILNAGIMPVTPGTTTEGYEITFGVNYLGHALLTRLLTPTMLSTAKSQPDVRIVIVASEGHGMAPKGGVQYSSLKTPCEKMGAFRRYGQSKIALIGLARELAREYPVIKAAAIHPGRISTGISTELTEKYRFIRMSGPISRWTTTTVEMGARNQIWAATSGDVVSGKYYIPTGIEDKKTLVDKDASFSKKLWEWTENELKGIEIGQGNGEADETM